MYTRYGQINGRSNKPSRQNNGDGYQNREPLQFHEARNVFQVSNLLFHAGKVVVLVEGGVVAAETTHRRLENRYSLLHVRGVGMVRRVMVV